MPTSGSTWIVPCPKRSINEHGTKRNSFSRGYCENARMSAPLSTDPAVNINNVDLRLSKVDFSAFAYAGLPSYPMLSTWIPTRYNQCTRTGRVHQAAWAAPRQQIYRGTTACLAQSWSPWQASALLRPAQRWWWWIKSWQNSAPCTYLLEIVGERRCSW